MMLQLIVPFVTHLGRARRRMQENPRGKRRLTRRALAAWLVAASVGALLPAWASVAADVSEVAKLLASDGAAFDQFGNSVAVDGDTAVVGAPTHEGAGNVSGSAYVFRYDGTDWTEEARLTASDGGFNDQFGHAVALDGGTAVVGASWDDDDNEPNPHYA